MSVRQSLPSLIRVLCALTFLLVLGISSARAQGPSDDLLREGARLYQQNCAVCHGAQGEGRVGAQLAKNWPSIRPDLTVRTIIENGVPGTAMPAWSQARGGPLSEAEIEALMAYILSWQTGGAQIIELPTATLRPPITPLPQVEGDPNRGAVLFDHNCAVCHGANGQGRIGATLAKNWAGIRVDLSLKTTIQNGVEGTAMPAWSQARGGPLSETEINDLVAFILTLPGQGQVVMASPTVISPLESTAPSPWRGWLGVVLAAALLLIVVASAFLLQRGQRER